MTSMKGKRTYLVLIALGVYLLGVRLGWWPHWPEIDAGLGGLALAFHRAALANLESTILGMGSTAGPAVVAGDPPAATLNTATINKI